MSKYEVIKAIMESKQVKDEKDKVYAIEMFLKGWWTEEQVKWFLED